MTWLVITYCLLWAVTAGMLPWEHPGLFDEYAPDYGGLDPDAARDAAIDDWEDRYRSVGIPGTVAVAAAGLAWFLASVRQRPEGDGRFFVIAALGVGLPVGLLFLLPLPHLVLAGLLVIVPWFAAIPVVTAVLLRWALRHPRAGRVQVVGLALASLWATELAFLSLNISSGTWG